MSKRITILGSTGSIGRQSLEVISACGMEAVALTANSSVKLLEEQARRYRPELAVLMDERAAGDLRVKLADTNVRVLGGMEGILEAASLSSADTVITAVVGMIGLRPTLAAIRRGSESLWPTKKRWYVPASLYWRRLGTMGPRSYLWIQSTPPFSNAWRATGTGERSNG